MARLIPNENTWVGFLTSVAGAIPTQAEIAAGVNLTPFLISLNAASQGNTVPTPAFDTLFETSISGTNQASFTADFYRDDASDDAWDTLPRGTSGYFVIARFGGSGTAGIPEYSDVTEVWPVVVTSRTMQNMANNTVMTFSVTCSVPVEPNESAAVLGVPGVPTGVVGTLGDSEVSVAYVAPVSAGHSAITGYKVYAYKTSDDSLVAGSPFADAASPYVVTSLTNGTSYYFRVKATNTEGDSAFSAKSAAVIPSA